MKLLVNAAPLTGLLTGISRYLRNLYAQLMTLPAFEVHFFDGKHIHQRMPRQAEPGTWIRSTEAVWRLPDAAVVGLRSLHWLLYEFRLNTKLRGHYDVYHETAFTPAKIRRQTPQVFTLHDLSLMHYRQYHPKERVWFSDIFFNRRLPEADHIIVPSTYIKNEVRTYLKVPEGRISVIHEAPDPFFYPRTPEQVETVRNKLCLPAGYLFFVGTLEPRKNLALLIEAMRRLPPDTHLVLAGWKGWGERGWQDKIAGYGLSGRVHFTGYIDEEALACLYSGASALVYPSFYEGFGLPLLEAMASGCPVICSDAACLPEVAGDAALYFNPKSVDALVEQIRRVLTDSDLAEKMRAAGRQQAARFSWQTAAKKTAAVFKQLARP